MGWRGILRATVAAAREAERNAQRRARAAERAHRQAVKEAEQGYAQAAVEEQTEYLAMLTGAHREPRPPLSWSQIASAPPPPEPVRRNTHEAAARAAHDTFRPSLLQRITGAGEREKAALFGAIAEAQRRDICEYEDACAAHAQQVMERGELVALARRVLAREPAAYLEALREFAAELQEGLYGRSVQFSVFDSGAVLAVFAARGPEVVPARKRSLLASGKLSERAFPKGEAHELYLDYIASSAIRVGQEVLAILPLDRVFVDVTVQLVDGVTGHLQERCVLSLQMPRETLTKVNVRAADPSECLANFAHRSGIRKGKPLEHVSPLAKASP